MSCHKLKVVAINVNSIIRIERRSNLLGFIKSNEPDILLLGETKLNKTHNLTFEHYNFIRTDRKNAQRGGGTAILLKKTYKYTVITIAEMSGFQCIETTVISLNLQEGKKMYIISAYSPVSNAPIFKFEFEKIFELLKLNEPQNFYLIAGDMNAKHTNWLNPVNDPRGVFVNNWMENNHINYKCILHSPVSPTYPRGNSYLDICFSDARIKIETSNAIQSAIDNNHIITKLPVLPYDSDHYAISMTCCLEDDHQFILDQRDDSPAFNFGRTNWKRFQKKLTNISANNIVPNDRNMSNCEIDDCIDMLDNQIESIIIQTVPRVKHTSNMSAFSTPAIKRLQQEKSKLVSAIFHLYRTNQNNNNTLIATLKSMLKNIKTLLKQHFNNSINDYWYNKLSTISQKDSHNMLPQINRIFRKKSRDCLPDFKVDANDTIISNANIDKHDLFTMDNKSIITNDVDKLNIIGRHFESIHRQNANLSSPEFKHEVQEIIEEFERNKSPNSVTKFTAQKKADMLTSEQTNEYFTTLENLQMVFYKLNNKKSSGLDKIPNVVLKHIPNCIISQYCVIFNNALNNKYFPTKWKIAKVYPILKKGKDKSRYDSFRPISLLPNVSKVFEVIINQAIQQFCDNKSIIPNSQFGFRRNHSTVHAIAKFTSDCCWHLNNRKIVGACLIDLEKAFDTVWREGLIYKLIHQHFPTHIIHMIQAMISAKQFVVTNGEITTDTMYEVSDGLQQGALNSPIFFSLYIAELLESYEFNVAEGRHIIAYADDIIIYTADRTVEATQNRLQHMYNNILTHLHKWKLRANPQKCETILIRPTYSHLIREVQRNWRTFHISTGENAMENIPHKTVVKYLGVHIDQYLNFNEHVSAQLKKTNMAFGMLKKLLFNKYLSATVKIICYKALIRPIMTYGFAIWFNVCPSYMEKCRVLERKILRMCMSRYRTAGTQYTHYIRNSTLYTISNIERVDVHMLKLVRNHCDRSSRMVEENDNIWQAYYPQDLYFEKTRKTGFIPPEAFIYLDTNGYIQDDHGVPILYHIHRRPTQKGIEHGRVDLDRTLLRFNLSIPETKRSVRQRHYWQE